MSHNDSKTSGQGRFQRWAAAGFAHLVSVTVPGCPLYPGDPARGIDPSSIDPATCGKAPGRLNKLGSWGGYTWEGFLPDAADLARWEASGANVGLQTERWPAVDCDIDEAELSAAVWRLAGEMLGEAPTRRRGAVPGGPRWGRLYRWELAAPKLALAWRRGGRLEKVELLGDGQQTVVQGMHPSGERIWWDRRPVAAELPLIDADAIERFFSALETLVDLYGGEAVVREEPSAADRHAIRARVVSAELRREMEKVAAAIDCGQLDYFQWIKHMAAWKEWTGGDETLYAELVEPWAESYADNTPAEIRKRWDSFSATLVGGDFLCAQARLCTDPDRKYNGPGTAICDFPPLSPEAHARAAQAREDKRAREAAAATVETVPALSPRDEAAALGYTDAALAAAFADQHADSLRHVAAFGKWLLWDGKVWRFDEKRRAVALVIAFCRATAANLDPELKPKARKRIEGALESARTIAAVEKLASADPRLAAGALDFDRDPWLLNTPAGIVDLRSGALGPHDPGALLSKITRASPGGKCPVFDAFIARVCGGDAELISYLQRVFGYALTGSTREQALFFFYGHGANGKSVTLGAFAGLMGDYAVTAPMETFTASAHERHPTEIAGLRGARLVTAIETEEGRRWAEAKISALTGGDKISARFMRQDFFEFVPEFKLIVAGNHKPGLRGVGEAIARRMNMVPFAVTIPVEERDKMLSARLEAEWGGILAWAIAGCLAWQAAGLAAPAVVASATADYLAAEDVFGQWLAEAVVADRAGFEMTAELFKRFTHWANRRGEFVGRLRRFVQLLESRMPGIVAKHTKAGNGFVGVRLLPENDYDTHETAEAEETVDKAMSKESDRTLN